MGLRILKPETVNWLRRGLTHGKLLRAALMPLLLGQFAQETVRRLGWRGDTWRQSGDCCDARIKRRSPDFGRGA